ncbi:hypothetical protein MJ1_0492 [Nanobdella aerobiophila]|uniref:Uncharacterized protein n=1 Tax=Nanobdella aerobiophila TaxID=2586965 RepID=A0A915SKZ2_9ARCH|nr:hypothetical protein [Nanobdella aerobiophila]BBL45646.1 hypothetical protein MJ1_0492 [Nanobdella aerobiophila]
MDNNIIDEICNLKSFNEYINYIRRIINKEYNSCSYFFIGNNGSEYTDKKDIFPKIYSEYLPNIEYLKSLKNRGIIGKNFYNNYGEFYQKLVSSTFDKFRVSIRIKDDEILYETLIGNKRKDINIEKFRRKLPESLILYNKKGEKIKLSEIRPYNSKFLADHTIDVEKDIKSKYRALKKNIYGIYYVPLLLGMPLIINNKNIKELRYISKPYYQENPYILYYQEGTYDMYIMPILTAKNNLSALIISDIVKNPTIPSYILGLDYKFEFDRDNLNNFYVKLPYDEFLYKLTSSIELIIKSVVDNKYSISDIALYQITRGGNDINYIDIASGLEVPTNSKTLESLLLENTKDLIDSIKKIKIFKYCKKEESEVICSSDTNDNKFIDDIYKDIIGENNYFDYKSIIFKNTKLYNLEDIIKSTKSYKKDDFDDNKKALEHIFNLYLSQKPQ